MRLLHGRFLAKNESKVPGRIRKWDVVRTKSNRIREGNSRRFQGRQKGKEKSFCFVVVQFELIFRHPCFYVVCACIEFFGEVGHFTERSGFLELCVICEKLMVYRVVSYDIGERTETIGGSRLNAKNRVQVGENLVVNSGRKIQQKNRNVVIVQSRENIVYNT